MSTREDHLLQLCGAPINQAGVVRHAVAGGLATVVLGQGEIEARQAVSCLLAPQAGDRVWLSGDLQQGVYVTAILERASPGPENIRLPEGSGIEVPAGALNLRAGALNLQGGTLAVQADSAALCVGAVTAVGREAAWSFGRVRIVSELIESFADRLLQFARWSQRTVEGIDQVRSGQIDYRAEQLMQLRAQNLVANASNLAKVDGEQIHLG